MIRIASALVAAALIAVPASAQQDFSKVEIKATEIGSGIYMLEGAGGNIGISVGEDGVFMIDDQFAPLTEKIQAAVAEITDQPIKYVINTHFHFDHTGGNENLGNAGAVLVAHDNVRKRMSTDQFNSLFDRTFEASPEAALPDLTYSADLTLHFNGLEAHVHHVKNAHTDGDSIIFFRGANVIHMGDTFFNGNYPFIDVDGGGSVDGMIAAVEKVLEMTDDETAIIPGHGPLAKKAELEAYLALLVDVRKRVAKLVKRKKSLEDVLAADPLKDLNEKYGQGFINGETMTKILYTSLKDKK